MTFAQAITSYWKNYVVFNGRSRRSAYWYSVLFTALISMAIGIAFPGHTVDNVRQQSVISDLWSLATFLPSLAVGVRRLHDVGRSGWYLCWALLPIVGWIFLIVALAKDGDKEANKYGQPVTGDSASSKGTGGTQDY